MKAKANGRCLMIEMEVRIKQIPPGKMSEERNSIYTKMRTGYGGGALLGGGNGEGIFG
jgi:hypothetical protein